MSVFQAVTLGAVQGITEFFPISSSGHLVVFQHFFGMKEPQLAFDIFLHLGTLISVLIYFYWDILNLFENDRKLLLYLVIASVPTFIIGFLFKDSVEGLFVNPRIVGFMLLVTGTWLILAHLYEKYMKMAEKKVGIINSIIVGIAQGIAIIPGISRSGSTIATGILSGLEKNFAFKFSFLLSIPAILGASVVKAHKIEQGLSGRDTFSFIVGAIVAAIVGLFAIKVLSRLIFYNKLYIFSVYCFIIGLLLIIFV